MPKRYRLLDTKIMEAIPNQADFPEGSQWALLLKDKSAIQVFYKMEDGKLMYNSEIGFGWRVSTVHSGVDDLVTAFGADLIVEIGGGI